MRSRSTAGAGPGSEFVGKDGKDEKDDSQDEEVLGEALRVFFAKRVGLRTAGELEALMLPFLARWSVLACEKDDSAPSDRPGHWKERWRSK